MLKTKTFKILQIIICLNIFFISINLMGAFKGDTKAYAEVLFTTLYKHPFLGLLVGILITSIIQSSSATTSILVAFVAAGLFGSNMEQALYGAIPIIMGANIGTSITSIIVSLGHIGNVQEFKRAFSAALVHDLFNLLTVAIVFPFQVTTNFLGKIAIVMAETFSSIGGMTFVSPLELVIKPQVKFVLSLFDSYPPLSKLVLLLLVACIFIFFVKMLVREATTTNKKTLPLMILNGVYLGGIVFILSEFHQYIFTSSLAVFILGLTVLFISLGGIVKIVRGLAGSTLEVLFNKYIFKSPIRALAMGTLVTVLVQSSSVSISIMIPLAGAGIVTLNQIFPYVMGANIGTTITAILAALSLGSVAGIAIAFSHLLFNVVGTCVWYPARIVPIRLAQYFTKLALINKAIPILMILFVYIVLPLTLIMIFK